MSFVSKYSKNKINLISMISLPPKRGSSEGAYLIYK